MRALLLSLLACMACHAPDSRDPTPMPTRPAEPETADTTEPTQAAVPTQAGEPVRDRRATQVRLRIDPGLEPTASTTYANAYASDPPVEVEPLALVRLDSDAMSWERVRFDSEPRLFHSTDRFPVEDWLGLELQSHQTYTLRARVGEKVQDVWFMVSGVICQDFMLPPPPAGTQVTCIATPDGAMATYVVPPTSALEAATAR